MATQSPEHDGYIADAAPFARPILTKVRRLMHKACPTIEETMKWRSPCYEHKGIVVGVSAFKQHVRFGFWKGRMLKDDKGLLEIQQKGDVGTIKWSDVKDMPSDAVLLRYMKAAVALNEKGVKSSRPKKKAARARAITVPDDLMAALKRSKKALATYEAFSPSKQREYVEWVTEAKREATRTKRIATAVEWMAEGKPRHWKYMKKR